MQYIFTEEEYETCKQVGIERNNSNTHDSADYSNQEAKSLPDWVAGWRGYLGELAATRALTEMFGAEALEVPPAVENRVGGSWHMVGDLKLHGRVVEVRTGDVKGRVAVKRKDYNADAIMVSVWIETDGDNPAHEADVVGWCFASKNYTFNDWNHTTRLKDMSELAGVFEND